MTRLFLAFVAVFLLTSCSMGQADSSMSESDAYDRAEAYVRRAATALPADAQLEAAAPPASESCKGEPADRVMVVSTYFVRGLADEDKHFDTMLHWWEAHDFELLDDLRPERHYVWVRNKTDSFRMSLRDNDKGELLLAAQSPCLTAGTR
jgi:hypothetical protein